MKIIKFYADWCGPCKVFSPILKKFANDNNIELKEIDIDKDQEMAIQYNVTSIPHTVFENGDKTQTLKGVVPEEVLLSVYNSIMSND